MTVSAGYALDNSGEYSVRFHTALGRLLDWFSLSEIQRRVPDLGGRRILDVGAGGGSLALALAGLVGDNGAVIATDKDAGLLPAHPRLFPMQHDIVAEALPSEMYHVVIARLLLSHLPDRLRVLDKLIRATKPGGLLALMSFVPPAPGDFVVSAPSDLDRRLLERFLRAHGSVFRRHGLDPSWARDTVPTLRANGMTEIQEVTHGAEWYGGDPGCLMLALAALQLRPEFDEEMGNAAHLTRVLDALQDPSVRLTAFRAISTTAIKPGVGVAAAPHSAGGQS